MRYAEIGWRLSLAGALIAGGAACSSIGPTTATASATPPAVVAPPVSPAAQQAFDDAVRALAAGQVAQAESGFRALTASHPELGGPHADLGLIYRQAGKLAEAVAALEQAVLSSPQQPVYLNQLGLAYREQGQFDKARDAYERALASAPEYAAATLNLGILNDLYLGDAKRALELYERYLALSPGGDATVNKWVVDLNNRKPQRLAANRKDKP